MNDQWWIEAAEFVKNQLDQDEWWAREASRDGDNPVPDAGHHWQWVNSETDEVIVPDPAAEEYVDDAASVSLRSVERYPTKSEYLSDSLPQFAIHTVEEVSATVGGHIIRHDPARTLTDVASDRQLLAIAMHQLRDDGEDQAAGDMVRALATRHAEREGFNAEWAMSGEDWQL